MQRTFAYILVIACLSVSCAPEKQQSLTTTETADTTSAALPITAGAATEERSSTAEIEAYPGHEYPFELKVIRTGFFHGDEVWDGIEAEAWLGLFKNDSGYYIHSTNITAMPEFDALVDNEGDTTGVELATDNPDDCLLLMSSAEIPQAREIASVDFEKDMLYPGDSMVFDFLGRSYMLQAFGAKNDQRGFIEYHNYQLFLTETVEGRKRSQLIVAHPAFDDTMTSILFLGDIDGDSILDLIIDTTHHYNAFMPTLYLSTRAKAGEIARPVGRHVSVGC